MTHMSMHVSATGCDRFLVDFDSAIVFRVPHDTFPILTDPETVRASQAEFMRPDDWILGLRVGQRTRCYPEHMLDNVHVVNDTIDGHHYAVMHCEICCSNAVFVATLDKRRLTFGTGGLVGGTLALYDEQTRSLWSHGMGVACEGPLAGRSLTRVESFQASYAEWVTLYPDTEVMVWPRPVDHPDCRHGHGTDAWFGQSGIEPLVLRTMPVKSDPRLPEHEIVISVFTSDGNAALPVQNVIRAGGFLSFTVGGHELVAVGAGPDSCMVATFRTHLRNRPQTKVDLALHGDRLVDLLSGSVFRVDGRAVSGPLADEQLEPVATMTNKWHSLICFLPDVAIVSDSRPTSLDEGPLKPAFDILRADGLRIEPTRRHFALELPHGALAGYDLLLNDAPFATMLFASETIAREQLLWTAEALQAGRLVLVSTPPIYSDWSNTTRRPASAFIWPAAVDKSTLRRSLARAAADDRSAAPLASLTTVVDELRARGLQVHVRRAAYRGTLPVGAVTGMVAEIDADPFIVLRFESPAAAMTGAPLPEHSVVAGPFVLQSDPPDMYANRERRTQRRPDASVKWSTLLGTGVLSAALSAAARSHNGASSAE